MSPAPRPRRTGNRLGAANGLPLDLERQLVDRLRVDPKAAQPELAEYFATDLVTIQAAQAQIVERYRRRLTNRQKYMLELMARGWRSEMIAAEVNLTAQQVRDHLRQAYQALGVTLRPEALVIYELVSVASS